MSEPLPNTLVAEAPAKVNLFLRVLGRREDGYHDLETVLLPLSLADRLEVHAFADPAFHTLSIAFDVLGEPALVALVPGDESNLVVRAATALGERCGVRGFADILLEKRVPAAAGLGGGSSDAAAALRALNDLWGCGLTDEDLEALGAEVGSDVPALLRRRPVLVRGRGERVEPVAAPVLRWALLAQPFEVRTADAFGWWDRDGGATGPDPEPILRAAREGSAAALGPLLHNDLEEAVSRRHPAVRGAKERLLRAGALGSVMCGSGPTVAGLLPAEGPFDLPDALVMFSAGSDESQNG